MLKYIFIGLTLLISTKSCKVAQHNLNGQDMKETETILSGNWEVTSMEGIDSISKKPTFIFDTENQKISGNAGCNRYGASYVQKDSLVTFTPGFATKMYCGNMPVEKVFFENLEKVVSFKIENEELLFFSSDGLNVMRSSGVNK